MKRLLLVVTAFLVLVLGSISCAPSAPPTPVPAALQVAKLSIDPGEVKPGEKVTVTAEVTNTGGTEGTYTAELKINGVTEATQKVTVAAGASQRLSFTVSRDTPRTYKISLGELTGEFVVAKPLPTPIPPPPEQALPELTVHFIDVGQGDAILLDIGETEVLIDGGGKSPGVVVYLREYVDGPLEVMVATHPHADHIGGLIAVLDAFEVEEIWLNGDTSTSKTFQQFMSRVNAEGASVHEAGRGDSIEVDVLTFLVLHPVKPLFDDINNNSVVLRLSYGNIDFLFTGDAEMEAEASILAFGPELQSEILKVGHHGSKTSSSKAFLAEVQPEMAIHMAGTGNRYGHPHAETISALEGIGAEIYGTDMNGTIVVTTDGITYEVQTEK